MILVALLLAASPAASTQRTRIVVMDLQPSGVPAELAAAVAAQISLELETLGVFKAMTTRDIKEMAALEESRQIAGCQADTACLAEIGGALGANYMITGSVLFVSGSYLLQLQLVNTKRGGIDGRVSRDHQGGPRGLLEEARVAARLVVRDLLALQSGTLRLAVSEEGATVRIDGTIVGVSPLPPLSIAGGAHTVAVEREGFILELRDVTVEQKKETTAQFQLRPSEEFKRDYRRKAMRIRGAAWASFAVAAASAAAATALFVTGGMQGNALRNAAAAYNESDRRTPAALADLERRQRTLGTLDALALSATALTAAAITTGLVLYLSGDAPSRYDLYVAPSLGGAALGGAF